MIEGDFEEEPVSRPEVEVGVKRLKNGKSTGKNVVTDEKIKSGSKLMMDSFKKFCSMDFDSGVVLYY